MAKHIVLLVLLMNIMLAHSMDNNQQIPSIITDTDEQKQTSITTATNWPNINIEIEVVFDIEDIKTKLGWVLEGIKEAIGWLMENLGEMMVFVGVGALIGAVIPLVLYLTLCVLGFTVTGVVAGSIAACCQSPQVLAGGCFATMQSLAATSKMLLATPFTAALGTAGGLIYFLFIKYTGL